MMMMVVIVMGGDRLGSALLNYGYRYYLRYTGEGEEGGFCLCQIRQGGHLSFFIFLLAHLSGVHPF